MAALSPAAPTRPIDPTRWLTVRARTNFLDLPSYALPVWERRWHDLLVRAGDAGVTRAGLGDGLVAFLRTCPRTDATRARLRALSPPGTQRPALGLVTR
jgi:hypothetical protein